MKVCLYQEGLEYMKMVTQSGITSAFNHLKEALEKADVEYTTDINDDFDILHINFGIGPTSMTYANYYRKKGKKVIIHAHTTSEDFANSFIMSDKIGPIVKKTLQMFYSQGDIVLCPSVYTKTILSEYNLGVPIIPVSNGVDTNKFKKDNTRGQLFREENGISRELVFSVGQVFKRKGVFDFCDVAEHLPQFDFRWFGKVYDKFVVGNKEIKYYLETPPFNLKFSGFVPDIIAAFSAGDIFFFPSYEENQGIVILEAASIGVPIIVRDIPVYRDWLFHEENVLKGMNNKEFITLITMLSEDDGLKKKLVSNGRRLAEKHDLKNIGLRLKKIYEHLYNSEMENILDDEVFMTDPAMF
ncbi:glycosyltransferase family 4 protein [Candidatus Micrarchaeota archaeon]|nr:glycosyltransferase family 4 protein [Candidatus Micrarchaeota archaeon]